MQCTAGIPKPWSQELLDGSSTPKEPKELDALNGVWSNGTGGVARQM
jgi:hypothetical protein